MIITVKFCNSKQEKVFRQINVFNIMEDEYRIVNTAYTIYIPKRNVDYIITQE